LAFSLAHDTFSANSPRLNPRQTTDSTRGCMFCAVNTDSKPAPPDPFEPFKTAEAVTAWGVDYIVLTSVDRDDIEDGGAQHFAHTVELLKHKNPDLLVECLVSDFQGMKKSVETLSLRCECCSLAAWRWCCLDCSNLCFL
jgi:lipoate synthase